MSVNQQCIVALVLKSEIEHSDFIPFWKDIVEGISQKVQVYLKFECIS